MTATTSEMALIIRARNQASHVLGAVGKDLDTLDGKARNTASKGFAALQKAGVLAFAAVGAAAAIMVVKGVGAMISFDAKMTESLAIMGDISGEMRTKMELAAREVAKTTQFSAEQAAESYFFLASAGLNAEQSIAALPAVARFAQAGMFDMSRATDLATDAQSAMGLVSKDSAENLVNLTRVTDVFVKANTLANASVEQFSESMTNKAGAALKLVNKDIEEGTAVLAVYADQGVKGQVAGENLSRLIKALQINALKNTEQFEKMGISVFDSAGKMRNFADITEDLTGAFDGLSDAQTAQALLDLGFEARQQDVIKMLLGTEDQIRKYEAALREAGGTTEEVATKQLESIKAQWGLFKDKIRDVFIEIGTRLKPVIEKLLPILSKWAEDVLPRLADGFSVFVGWIESLVKYFGAVLDSGDPLNDFLMGLPEPIRGIVEWGGKMVVWFQNLSPEVKDAIKFGGKLVGVLALVAGAVSILTAVLGVLFSPIVLVIAAIAAVGAALYWAYHRFEGFRKVVDAVVGWFKNDAVNDFKRGIEIIRDTWNTFWKTMKELPRKAIDAVKGFVQSGIDKVRQKIEEITGAIRSIWDSFWGAIGAAVHLVFDPIAEYISEKLETIRAVIEVVMAIISKVWEVFWFLIKYVTGIVWDWVSEKVTTVMDFIKGKIEIVSGVIEGIWNAWLENIWAPLVEIWDNISGFIRDKWDNIRDMFNENSEKVQSKWSTVWGAIETKASTIWGNIKSVAGTIWGQIEEKISTKIDTVKGVIETVTDTIREKWETFTSALSSAWSAVWDTISDGIETALSAAWGVIKSVANGILSGLSSSINGVIGSINNLISKYNSIPGSPDIGFIPTVRVPLLAAGGTAISGGLSIVGERGPELLHMPRGASVIPLQQSSGQGGRSIHVVVKVAGNVLTERDLVSAVIEGIRDHDMALA